MSLWARLTVMIVAEKGRVRALRVSTEVGDLVMRGTVHVRVSNGILFKQLLAVGVGKHIVCFHLDCIKELLT